MPGKASVAARTNRQATLASVESRQYECLHAYLERVTCWKERGVPDREAVRVTVEGAVGAEGITDWKGRS